MLNHFIKFYEKHFAKDRFSFEWGVVWMLLSAAFLSFSFVFLKLSLFYLDYFFLLFLRFFLPFLCVILIATVGRKWKQCVCAHHVWLQLARSGCVIVAQYGIALYIKKNTLLNATVLLNASPLFIPLLEWIFLKHRPGKSTILAALLAFLGVILILQPDRSLFTLMSGIGILAALGQAGSQVLYGIRSKNEEILSSIFYLFLFTTLFSFFIYLLNGQGYTQNIQAFQKGWVLSISVIVMAIATLFNQYFRGLAYRCGRPSTLATFLYFSVFISALFDWLIFKNSPSTLSIIGSILIILGGALKIFLRARILKKKTKP